MEFFNSPQFTSIIKNTLSDILDDKLARVASQESINSLISELKDLKKENDFLRSELTALKSVHEERIEELEIHARRNNLVFRGLKCPPNANYASVVTEFCKEILKVNIDANFIHAYPLGSNSPQSRPIIASFYLPNDKYTILKSVKVLKKTGFSVHHDLPVMTRKKRAKLLLIKREIARLNPTINVRVTTNSLLVNGLKFSWCMETGLHTSSVPALPKLNEIVGEDLSAFMKIVLEGSLPKDYFRKPEDRSQSQQGAPFIAQVSSRQHSTSSS